MSIITDERADKKWLVDMRKLLKVSWPSNAKMPTNFMPPHFTVGVGEYFQFYTVTYSHAKHLCTFALSESSSLLLNI